MKKVLKSGACDNVFSWFTYFSSSRFQLLPLFSALISAQVVRGINAFAIGVHELNPRASIYGTSGMLVSIFKLSNKVHLFEISKCLSIGCTCFNSEK